MTDAIVLSSQLMLHNQFVNYALKQKNDCLTKPTVDADGYKINAQKPANWRSLDEALR